MAGIKLRVSASGFKEGSDDFQERAARFEEVASRELHAFSLETIAELKRAVWANDYNLPAKRRDNGKPPLIDSGKYIDSYQAETNGLETNIGPTGMNDNMSNEELAEVLEFGNASVPARPHLRPLGRWIELKLPTLGERIVNGLSGRR